MNIVLNLDSTFITSATTLLIIYMAISAIKEYIRSDKNIITKKEDDYESNNPSDESIAPSSDFVYIPTQSSEIMQRAEEMQNELALINKESINNPPQFSFLETEITSPYLTEEFSQDVEIVTDEYEKELEDMYGRVRKDVED